MNDLMRNTIEIQDARIAYGATLAVDGLSLMVQRGERLVLMGRSGCGKSTLLKAIGGFVPLVSGSIKVAGSLVLRPSPKRFVVWQDLAQLLPWKTIEANVAWPLLLSGVHKKEAHARALEWLERVGLTKALGSYPHELSGGMAQRVAIARAFAVSPDVLLMDEPFSALDALSRERLQNEVIALQKSAGTTVVFVSHDVAEGARIGNRVVVLTPRSGRIKAVLDCGLPNIENELRTLIHDDISALEENNHV